MKCRKCGQKIKKDSVFCSYCGVKQEVQPKKRTRKRAHGTGTISKDKRYKNQYIAHAPASSRGLGRIYLGSYPTAAAAQAALEDYAKKGRPDLYNATVEDIYTRWSESHYKNISEGTARGYISSWHHMKSIKDIKMSELRTAHLQAIVDSFNGQRGAATSFRVLAKALCEYAMENDLLDKNYAKFVKLPKVEKAEKVIFTKEQLAVLWRHSDDPNVQTILVMIYMGFRMGEILSFTPENIHLDEGYIIGGIKTDAGKNRTVPFPPSIPNIKDFVSNWLIDAVPGEKLFKMSEQNFRIKCFYKTLIDLGLIEGHMENYVPVFDSEHHLTPHSTRHTFATLSVEAGMSLKELQAIIGHANIQTTLGIYTHTSADVLQSEMGKLTRDEDSA